MSSLALTANNQPNVCLHKPSLSANSNNNSSNSNAAINAFTPTRNPKYHHAPAQTLATIPQNPKSPTQTESPSGSNVSSTLSSQWSLSSNRNNATMTSRSASFSRPQPPNSSASNALFSKNSELVSSSAMPTTPVTSYAVPDTLLNSAFIFSANNARRNSATNSPLLSQPGSLNVSNAGGIMEGEEISPDGNTAPVARHSISGMGPGASKMAAYERSSSVGEPNYVRQLEEENALMCEELQATVVELSEARELARQFAFQRDQGQHRLQSILQCIYEQNTVLDQCCGQMDFLRSLVDESGAPKGGDLHRKSKSMDVADNTCVSGTGGVMGSGSFGLDGSTDEETDSEKTPEEVSASCVRKLNRLEVLLRHKLKEDKAMRIEMKKTKQLLSDQKMENEMLRIKLQTFQKQLGSSASSDNDTITSSGVFSDQFQVSSFILSGGCSVEESSVGDMLSSSSFPSNAKLLLETLSSEYEDMLRGKEGEIAKLRDDLHKAIRANNSIESTRRLKPGDATKEELVLLQGRIDSLTDEKVKAEVDRDELKRELTRLRAELGCRVEQLSDQLGQVQRARDQWRERFLEIEKEIQYVKETTEEKIQDMAVALVVAHDFQMEESDQKRRLEEDLNKTRGELNRLQGEVNRQRCESESMKRDLESEREAHRVQLDSYQKHAEELTTNVTILKQQLTDNSKPQQTNQNPPREKVPKLSRGSSVNNENSPPRQSKVPADFEDDNDDLVDHAPITKNVRSMVQNFEIPTSSPQLSKDATAPKQRRYSGAKRDEKRRGSFPVTQSTEDDKLNEVIADASNATASDLNIINKVSSAIKSLNEKFENTETPKSTLTSSHSKPRPLRTQMSSLEMSSKAYRSPLNKLKINDIVVTRGSVARDKSLTGAAKPNGSSGMSTGSNSSNTSDSEMLQQNSETSTSGCPMTTISSSVISSPVASTISASSSTHMITATLPPLNASSAGTTSSPLVTFTTSGGGDPVPMGSSSTTGENKALKELMQKGGHVSVRNALLDWCKEATKEFPGVEVTNFSSSWNDGLAFCALFYSCKASSRRKQLPPFATLRNQSKAQNFELAAKLADNIGVKFDLDVQKICATERPDWKTILPVVRSIFEGIASLD